MKRLIASTIILVVIGATPARADDLTAATGTDLTPQAVASFVKDNASNGSRVITLGGSKGKRWMKVVGGAALGAVAGAAHAALTGGDMAKDAAIGALVGGSVAFAVTKYQDRRLRGRDEVARDLNYSPEQGVVANVRIAPVAAVPSGGKVSLKVTYSAIGPNPVEDIHVSRYAAITSETGRPLRGFAFTPDPFSFDQGGGEYETTIEIKLVQENNVPVAPGTYFFAWVVDGEVQNMDSTPIVING